MAKKVKFELEFPMQASPAFLYQYISTPDGLSEWFADNVNSRSDVYNFIWELLEEKARRLSYRTEERVKFRWLENDEDDESYFEFRIQVDALTKDVALIVVDFAEEDEVEDSKMFWENQIGELKHIIGA